MFSAEYSLKDFQTYDATKPDQVIHSTDAESKRKWARKAAFLQLSYALELHRMDHQVTPEQEACIDKFSQYVGSEVFQNKDLVERADIAFALDTLALLGINVSNQRQQLSSWE